MQPADFTKDMWGQVLRDPKGYWFFAPRPLPPKLEITWELAGKLSAADRALSELAGVALNLPNPYMLAGPFVRREAVLSSRIEGTQASLSDLLFFEAAATGPPQPPDVLEVANYVRAMEFGLTRLEELPLSKRLIREIHGKLMEGVRGEHMTPGEFRRSQNWIGPPGCTLNDAFFVPPAVPEMLDALTALERYLHTESPLPPLVRMALVHYQFEAIHPFLDGNGRVGRLLLSLLLRSEGLLSQPLLYLSAFLERNREEYYARLLAVSQSGAWLPWVAFFLEGAADEARDAAWRAGKLLDLSARYVAQVKSWRSTAALDISLSLFINPVTTIPTTAKLVGITQRTAARNIQRLVEAGVLTEVTGRRRNRVFVAREIIDVIERPRDE